MARYTVDILDNNGQRIGFVPAPVSPEYRRRQNQATPFSFGVLAADDVAPLLTYGRRCILRRDGVERAAGTVTRRDLSGQVTRIECITDEALLRDLITPADWNYWAGWELGDAVRDLLMECVVQARNTPDDWAAAVEAVDVDVETLPGQVVLAKGTTGRYKSHGYITLQFEFELITAYQVLRWSEDVGEEVRIKAQFRTSSDGLTWGSWSEELQSVFPAEDGVALTGDERYIQVRMHLYTDNTSAKDKNGVPTGYSPVLNGVEVIARKPGPVSEGVIEDTEGVILPAYRSENEDKKETYSFNRENALRILQTWCEDFGYEFKVDGQRRLHFGKDLGATKPVVLRRTTNMDVKSLGDNADRLANVLHCFGKGDGPAQIRTTLRNQDSIDLYGERIGVFQDDSADTLAKLVESGNKHLAKVSVPEPQFSAHHIPVGELAEDIELYDTVTVVDPKSGVVTTARILDEERALTMSGEEVSLGLNCTLDNIIERIVKGQSRKPTPGGLPAETPRDVRAVAGYGYIQVSWSGTAALFIVEHSTDGTTFDVLGRTYYRNYLHVGLEPGSTHYYRVTALSSGGASEPSDTVSAVVAGVPTDHLDKEAPATPTGLAGEAGATGGVAWVELSWDANADLDLKEYFLRRRVGESMDWEHVATVPHSTTTHVDRSDVIPGTVYTYSIAAGDVVGNVSAWSADVAVEVPIDETAPGDPTGLSGVFRDNDVVFGWDACTDADYEYTVLEVVSGGVAKRTLHTTDTSYVYPLALNLSDHALPQANVTVRIAHVDTSGNVSGWTSATASKPAPAAPSGLLMGSATAHVHMSVTPPDPTMVHSAEFQLAAQADYSDAVTVASGAVYQGIIARAVSTGTNYGRVRFVDLFGQAGAWATGSTEAVQITRDDMQGAIFQIAATSDPAPASGTLDELWDADEETGPTFAAAPTIEFAYPMAWFFDMVRFHADRDCSYYVQAWHEVQQAWVDVVGSAAAMVAAIGEQWTVQRFDGNQMVASRRLRIVFDRAVQLTELKFWTITFADEILAQAIQAWQIDTASIHIGDLDGAEDLQQDVADALAASTGPINADVRPIGSISNQITMDSTGLKMRRAGETIDRMHLDARRLGFRDPTTNKPTAGIGYVRDLAQELDPTADPADLIQHGLFIAQGEIRATQSVMSESLTEGGTGFKQLADGSVALQKLSGILSVTIPERFIGIKTIDLDDIEEIALPNGDFEMGDRTGWTGTGTVSKTYAIDGTYGIGGTVNIYRDVPVDPGQILQFSVRGRGHQATGSVTVKIQWLDSNKTLISEETATASPGSQTIQTVAARGGAPADTAYARLAVVASTARVDTCQLFKGVAEVDGTVLDYTVPRAEACEQLKIDLTASESTWWQVEINGEAVLSSQGNPVSTTIDVRAYEGDLHVIARILYDPFLTWVKAELYQNQRLPLRAAEPRYSVTTCDGMCQTDCQAACQSGCEYGCQSSCEFSCQTACQASCQADCEASCQNACQDNCQSMCEATSQGGGCWIEGTPVMVYDPEEQGMREIPVEQLAPGMQMPWYNITADTIELTECISNQRTWTHTIYVAEVEGGHHLETTGEQPLDVLRDRDGERVWLKLPARYIKPGDRLVRPFDGTLHRVLSLSKTLRAQTYVYNPRTASGRYIAAGFSDPEKVLT